MNMVRGGKREHVFNVWGSKGTKQTMLHMNKAFEVDLDAREEAGNVFNQVKPKLAVYFQPHSPFKISSVIYIEVWPIGKTSTC